jgi:hypothetical protein
MNEEFNKHTNEHIGSLNVVDNMWFNEHYHETGAGKML